MKRGCQGHIALVGNKGIQPYLQVCKTSSEDLKVNKLKHVVKETCILRKLCWRKNFNIL